MAHTYSDMEPKRGFGFFIRHEAGHYHGYDPSELFWVTNRVLFEALFDGHTSKRKSDPFYDGPVHSCCYRSTKEPSGDLCGFPWAARLLFRSCRLGHDVFFARGDLKIHVLRMNGNYETAINRPGNVQDVHPTRAVSGSLDVTRHAEHLIGGFECDGAVAKTLKSPLMANQLALNYSIICFPKPSFHSNGSCEREDVTFHMYTKLIEDVSHSVIDFP